ncbi:MAG: hypothetical protein AB1765_11160, partial [Candidatus Hydrogenedentota bacterium]
DYGRSHWITKDASSGEENPQHYMENRFWFDVAPSVWSFLKMTVKGGGSRFDVQMQEGALCIGKYGKDSKGKDWGVELKPFKNWGEYNIGHNIDLVSNDSSRWDFNTGGVRFNAWGKDFWSHFVTGPSADGQDQLAGRWGKNFFNAQLTLANFGGYKRWDAGSNYNYYWGFEIRGNHKNFFSPANVYYQFNWATSNTTNIVRTSDNNLLDFEIRDFQFYGLKFGTLGFNLRYADYDKDFRDYISNTFGAVPDRKEYYGETYYNFPAKMATLVISETYRENQAGVKLNEDFNSRLEISFINNFSTKFIYKNYKDSNGIYPNYIFWLKAADEMGFIRAGFRIRDPETIYKKRFFGVEGNYNISKQLMFFSRLIVSEEVLTENYKQSLFLQLRYNWENTRFYLEYGPTWIGSNSLVEDDNTADLLYDDDWERKNQDRIQFLFQADW